MNLKFNGKNQILMIRNHLMIMMIMILINMMMILIKIIKVIIINPLIKKNTKMLGNKKQN